MAKVKYSALVSDMRNKLNGSVLSKNRYGSYIRNKVTPVNPQTSFQVEQRGNLASLSAQWRGLTDEQREGWRALSEQLPKTDIFGDSKKVSANALYVGLNLPLLALGQSPNESAPQPVSIPAVFLSNLIAQVDTGANYALSITISPATVPAGYALVVYATPSYSPGISFVKNQYRSLGAFTPSGGVVNLMTAYTARFGNMVVGNKISIRCALVSTDSGQIGLPQELSAVVAES